MLANPFVSQIVLVAFAGLLIAVAISDVRRLTIPNRYSVAVVLLYPFYVVAAPHGVDWMDGAMVGSISLAIGFLLFAMRFAGGGDVKFFAAVSLWAGSHLLMDLVFTTAIVGGVVALAMIIHRRLTAPRKEAAALGFSARAVAAVAWVNVLLGSLLMARAGGARVLVSGALPGSTGADGSDTNSQSNPAGSHAVGTLPYGAAISVGGIVVAAMLLMRG
jgi:prepilin peptidase CpaA